MASFSITQKTTNGMSIVFDNPSWNRAFKKLKGQVANAMWEASGKTMSDVQDHTYRYLKGFEGMYPTLATMVANSLDYDRGTRAEANSSQNPEINVIFGSRGPNGRSGKIGAGVHTPPDDTQGTYNIGIGLQEGASAGHFKWKGSPSKGKAGGAIQHGRQIGTMTGDSAWYGHGGGAYFYGYATLDYIGEAQRKFEAKIEGRLRSNMKKRLK
tara:strand:+ start:417 stop:1052 length:636 start_codon:yes stop_codon:yes gene_type:complete